MTSYGEVRDSFDKEGYTLLTKKSEFTTATSTMLEYVCPNGHHRKTRWRSWYNEGKRCWECRIKPYAEIKKSFENKGYVLLTTEEEYVSGAKTPLRFICPNGHESFIRWSNWSMGKECNICKNHPVTYNTIKRSFEEAGYILLTKECDFVSANQTRLEYECPSGHHCSITWDGWYHVNNRCPKCQMVSFNTVKRSFEKEVDYNLLTDENEFESVSKTPLRFICPNGHEHQIMWSSWEFGSRCGKCLEVTYKIVKESFGESGYKLLTEEEEYTSTVQTRLEYICPNGHKHTTMWGPWKNGVRCPKCRMVPFETIKDSFEKEGYTLLTEEENFVDASKTELEYICPNGHHNTTIWKAWGNGGNRCGTCRIVPYERIKESFEKSGYTLLTTEEEYESASKTPLRFICPNGHEHYIMWGNWMRGSGCSKCSHNQSRPEFALVEFLEELGLDIIHGDRIIIGPHELDIVIPDIRLAIEYCGVFFHNEDSVGKGYHLMKLNKCIDAGYRLINIFEDEWIHKRDIVETRLKYILGFSNKKPVYARQCFIENIDASTAKNFVERYHLQGYINASIKLGAFHGDELVSVMTFSRPSIAKGSKIKNGVWELSRFCSSTNVVGIASKFINFFRSNYEWDQIFSYADRRWSTGDLYEKLGFTCVGHTVPNYWYYIGDQRFHRFSFRKSVLKDKLYYFDPTITEWENMRINGYKRIWDCGSLKYVMEK